MSGNIDALERLIEAVEAGEARASHVAAAFPEKGLGSPYFLVRHVCTAGSLDAAIALHEALLPGHYAQMHTWPMPEMCRVDIGGGHTGRDKDPARAWLLAILRAQLASGTLGQVDTI